MMPTQQKDAPAQDSQAATPIKGREIIVKSLEKEGVEVIFGYPGGASMEIHQALAGSQKIKMILPRHEQAASFAACGYARATGRPGVCLATSGPGATNLITGIADAKMDSIPMVAVTGQVPTGVIGTDAFQETDIVGATLPLVKHSYLVQSIHDIPAVVHEAFELAVSGRPGPVLIDFPKDIQQQEAIPDFLRSVKRYTKLAKHTPAKIQIQKALKLIQNAKRPLIYAGGGVLAAEASDELLKFVKKTKIPVTNTLMGLGSFPEKDPLSLRMLGMHGAVYANIAMNHADVIIALGVRFDDRVTGKLAEFCKNAKFIHVDIDAGEINKNIKVEVPIQGDLKVFLQEINSVVQAPDINEWLKQVSSWKKEFPQQYDLHDQHITPQHVVTKLSEMTSPDTIVSVGVGQHQMWTAQFYDFSQPRTWLCSSGLGAMGFGLPAAMGAQVAYPKRTVVNIDGDGSFLMNIQELHTLRQAQIPVKNLILNNQYLGMVAQWEDRFYESMRGHTFLGESNFADIAKAFGVAGATITKPSEVEPALKEMLSYQGPYVLDVKYPYDDQGRGHVIPMIPGGQTYLDTILHSGQKLKDYWKL